MVVPHSFVAAKVNAMFPGDESVMEPGIGRMDVAGEPPGNVQA